MVFKIILVYYKLEGFMCFTFIFDKEIPKCIKHKLFIPDYCQICFKLKNDNILTLALDVPCFIHMTYDNMRNIN
jgi:hypothetical protein